MTKANGIDDAPSVTIALFAVGLMTITLQSPLERNCDACYSAPQTCRPDNFHDIAGVVRPACARVFRLLSAPTRP